MPSVRAAVKQRIAENAVERVVTDYLRHSGWRVIRLQSGLFSRPQQASSRVRIGEQGMPDYLILRSMTGNSPGPRVLAFFLECKAPDAMGKTVDPKPFAPTRPGAKPKMTTAYTQKLWRDDMAAKGFLTCVTDSLEGLKAWMQREVFYQ